MDITTYIERHLSQFASSNVKLRNTMPRAATRKAHRLQLERFALYCKAYEQITVNVCKDWINQTFQRGCSPSNKNQALSALTSFLRWLADERIIDRGDLDSWLDWQKLQFCKWKRGGPNHKFIRPDQLDTFMISVAEETPNANQASRDVACLGWILYGPARLGEVLKLEMQHVSYHPPTAEREYAYYQITMPPEIAKDGEEHILYLYSDAARIAHIDIFAHFQSYLKWRRSISPDGPLIVAIRSHRRGQKCSETNWHKIIDTVSRRSGVPITSHFLRHYFGEVAGGQEMSGVLSNRDVRQMFGHSSDRTTEGYTDHDNDPRLFAAHRVVAQAITNQGA